MKSLFELNRYFKPYKWKLFLGFLFILLSDIAQVYVPLVLRDSIDSLKSNVSSEFIVDAVIKLLAAALIAGVFRFLIRQTIIVVSREVEYDLLNDFWIHIQKLPYRFFKNTPAGNIMALGTNDISAVRMYLGPAVMYSVDTFTKASMVIAILFTIQPMLTLYILVPLPFVSLIVFGLSRIIHKKFTVIQERFADLTTKAQENFSGIRVIKSYVRENHEIEGFEKKSQEYMEKNIEKIKVQAMMFPLLFLFIGITSIILIWVGGTMVIDGELTIGELTAFVVYLGLLIWPMIAVGWVANLVQQASASMLRLKKVFEEKSEIIDKGDKSSIKDISGEIEFKNVEFRYNENTEPVVKKLNLKIKKGETLAIIGHTGSGKSSLVSLIPRLYDTTAGEVLLDGNSIKDIPIEVVRKNIGFVPQEAFLFSETIQENVLYGTDQTEFYFAEKFAKISHLDRDVKLFKDRYDTILGEKGITLSGGQKQRTSLARALAIDPKVLILDDSFSAVDTHTEEEILKNLKEFMKNRTSIIISHRVSTVKDADKIIVLKNGTIEEQGKHEDLVKLNGIYADLHQKQLLEDELKELG